MKHADVIACLEKAAGHPINDCERVLQEIQSALLERRCIDSRDTTQLEECILSLAELYIKVTGRKPGYSKSENITHFERFLSLLPLPGRPTPSRNRAAIKKLKSNPLAGGEAH